jgi:hypothetical protein
MDLGIMLVNKLRGRPAGAPLVGPIAAPPLDARMLSIMKRRSMSLEPSTREFVGSIISWARSIGIPAVLGETHRTPEDQIKKAKEGLTAIPEGLTGWHQYGRAFHLIIVDPATKQLDHDAYRQVGKEVRRRGGEWLGDKPLVTKKGEILDLAHFEFHPGLKLSSYRKTPLARKEFAMAARLAARYG